jgi:tetratricopeptide (TPR) repeat protein
MNPDHNQRWIRALVVTITLAGISRASLAQTPSDQVAPPSQPAIATSPVPPKSPGPRADATPEQVGDSLMAHQRYQGAIEQYKKAPRSSDVWNKMGVAYQLMFNLDDAALCYERALKLDPKNAIVMNNLGTVYVSLKQYARAEKSYRKALKVDSNSALVHKNLGTALLAEHKYQKGWQEYQVAVGLDSQIFKGNNTVRVENPASVLDRGAMNYYMAKGCVRAGQADRAIEYLRMAINEGFISPKKVAADQEFATLRDLPAFQQMLASLRAQ